MDVITEIADSPAVQMMDKIFAKIEGAYAPNTIRAYRADFLEFIQFCEERGTPAIPASHESVALYIDANADKGCSINFIKRKVSAIGSIHKFSRLPNPVKDIDVQLALRRMARKNGRINKQAYGLNKKLFEDLMHATGNDIFGKRDRALLQLGYASLCRRHELVQLLVEDIKPNEDGSVLLHQRGSKTDTERRGRWIYLSPDVWIYIKEWLEAADITQGPILRGIKRGGQVMSEAYGPGAINRTYKRLARKAGFDEALVKELSSHSTRVGAAQELLRTGASLLQVMQRGGWGLPQSVLKYVKNADMVHEYPTWRKKYFEDAGQSSPIEK
jgi:site-specific recombinase XerD